MRSVMVGAQEGRERLLDAAFDALTEEGPRFPTQSVARRADASKSLLFHHFRDREGLLDAMAARILSQTQGGLARLDTDYPNPRERLVALARTLLEDPQSPATHVRRVHLFWLEEDQEGTCRGALRDALLADYIAAVLQEGVATGALRSGVDPRRIADTLLARWHGITTLAASGRPVDFEREADRLVDELAALVFP